MRILFPVLLISQVLPLVVYASLTPGSGSATNTIGSFIYALVEILRLGLAFIVALSLLVFFWGGAKFIFNAGSETEREKGKKLLLWGVLAFFVMIGVWGIVGILLNTFFG